MPMKYKRGTWTAVRNRMNELITEGVAPRKAAAQVSREFNGAPAAGTIMNRFNNGWRVKGAVSNGHTEITALKDELREARKTIDRLEQERDDAIQELFEVRERAAHAEGLWKSYGT